VAAVPHSAPIAPSDGELGLASWEPGDLAGVVLPAWDDFLGWPPSSTWTGRPG
jgi:hypothetical protein